MDVGEDELNKRLFGGAPDGSFAPLPGQQSTDLLRAIAQQDPRGSLAREQVTARPQPNAADRQRADYLVGRFAELLRNTNVTASLPAHASPTLWSDPIDKSATYTLPAAAGAYTEVLSFTAPEGRWGRIDGYGVDVGGAFTYDGSILWRIRLNGQNVQDLADWGIHRGTIVQPRRTIIVVPQGQTLSFQVKRAVAAGATSAVTMALIGWTWRLRRNDEGTKAAITAF